MKTIYASFKEIKKLFVKKKEKKKCWKKNMNWQFLFILLCKKKSNEIWYFNSEFRQTKNEQKKTVSETEQENISQKFIDLLKMRNRKYCHLKADRVDSNIEFHL